MNIIQSIIRFLYVGLVVVFSGLFFQLLFARLFPERFSIKSQALGSKFSKVAEFLGPSYIKLGQFLSTRPDLIGFKMADELAKLQDRLKPFSFKYAKHAIERNCSKPLEEAFEEFDQKPSAAASVAQVHKAKLKCGTEVAVKILRPRVERMIAKDIRLFFMIARIMEFFSSNAKRLRLVKVVHKLKQMVNTELDLRLEAASSDVLRHNLADDENVIVPKVYWQYSFKDILVSKWCHGVPINDFKKIDEMQLDRKEIVRTLASSFFNQAFRNGFFHADLHPGNILVNSEGKIILIDFGIMGTLDDKSRVFVADMLHGFITRDYDKVAQLHFEIGYVEKSESLALFSLACRSIGEPIIGLSVDQISIAQLMRQLFKVSRDFNIKLQPQLILLQKTLVTIEGVGYSLYPDVNMWQLAEPWIAKWGKENLSRFAKLKRTSDDYLEILGDLPQTLWKLENVIELIEKGLKKKNNSEPN